MLKQVFYSGREPQKTIARAHSPPTKPHLSWFLSLRITQVDTWTFVPWCYAMLGWRIDQPAVKKGSIGVSEGSKMTFPQNALQQIGMLKQMILARLEP